MNGKNGFTAKRKQAMAWLSTKAMPAMAKIGNQRHLSALRDGFAIITPLIIAGSLALVIRTSVFGAAGTEEASLFGVWAHWDNSAFVVNGQVTDWGRASDVMNFLLYATGKVGLDLITVYFAFALGFFLARGRGNSAPEIGGLLGLGSFFIATLGGTSSASYITASGGTASLVGGGYMGAAGIFTAMVVVTGAVELYSWLCTIKQLELKMPEGVPPAVGRAFGKLLPIIIASLAVTAVLGIVLIPTKLVAADVLNSQTSGSTVIIGVSKGAPGTFYNLGDLIYMAVQAPFVYAAGVQGANLGLAVLYVFIIGLFWFFGLHGANVANSVFVIWLPLLLSNYDMISNQGLQYLKDNGSIFVGGAFDSYIFLGGSGATLTLIFATLWLGKRPAETAIARFSLPAGVFQINEPVIFGYPLVANPLYFVPYVFGMPVLVVTTYLFHLAFGTTPVYAQIPWTAPAGLGALFATGFDYSSFIIVLINLLVSFAIWVPFVLISNRLYHRELKENGIAKEAKDRVFEAAKETKVVKEGKIK